MLLNVRFVHDRKPTCKGVNLPGQHGGAGGQLPLLLRCSMGAHKAHWALHHVRAV